MQDSGGHPTQEVGHHAGGFSSFNAAAFFQQQQQNVDKRQADLQQAAEKYLQTSSESEPESVHRRHVTTDTDTSSSSPQHRKRKRNRKDDKKKKSKQRRRGSSDEQDKILRMEMRAAAQGLGSGKGLPSNQAWAGGQGLGGAQRDKLLYFDVKGDMQNVVYKGLYAMNKASFIRRDPLSIARNLARPRHLGSQGDAEVESRTQGSRYFHPQHIMAERSRRIRRVHLTRPWTVPAALTASRSKPRFSAGLSRSVPLPAYISLSEHKATGAGSVLPTAFGQGGLAPLASDHPVQDVQEEGETAEEWLLRRTKELNAAARDSKGDVSAWMALVDFQDEVGRVLGGRGRRAQLDAHAVAGKKVSILERGVATHPGNPQLLLALLRAAAPLLDPPTLSARWEAALRRWQSDMLLGAASVAAAVQGVVGEALLWQHYVRARKVMFTTFTQADLQVVYSSAVSALCLGLARLEREGAGPHQLAAAEMEVVRLLLDSIQAALLAGQNESAIARIQALLEFHACAPAGVAQHWAAGGMSGERQHYSLGASLRLWCGFWDSGVPRIGEAEAQGWATWFRQQHEDLLVGPIRDVDAAAQAAEAAAEAAQGGSWSGWVVMEPGEEGDVAGDTLLALPGKAGEGSARGTGAAGEERQEGQGEGGVEEGGGEEEGEEGEIADDAGPQMTEEELLEQLGLKLEQELEGLKKQGVPPHIMSRWLVEEQQRSAGRWAPARPAAAAGAEAGEEEAAVDPEAVVATQDLRGWLFPIQAVGVRERLLLGCCALLGAPLGPSWTSSNQPLLVDTAAPLPNTLSAYMLTPSTHIPYLALAPTHPGAANLTAMQPAAPTGTAATCVQPAVCPVPWYTAHETRRQFLAGVLKTLVGASGPLKHSHCTCLAYLLVEASHVDEAGVGQKLAGPGEGWVERLCAWSQLSRAREAAKQLLAVQRHNLAMWGALAMLEALAGETKAARRVFDAALAGAQSVPGQEVTASEQLPWLAVQAALHELHGFAVLQSAGGDSTWQPVRGWAPAEVKLRHRRALHYLLWLLTHGMTSGNTPSTAFKPMKASDPLPTTAQVVAARQAVATQLPGISARAVTGELNSADTALLFASGLLEVLAGRCIPGSGGSLPATLAMLRNVLSRVPRDVRRYSLQHEILQERFCQLAVACTVWSDVGEEQLDIGLVLPPTAVKSLLLEALDLYPHNQSLLHLMVAYEHHAHALTRLHQYLAAACQAHASAQLLAVALTCEAGRVAASALGGLRQVLERAAASEELGSSPEVWLMYIRFEMSGGRLDAARRVFLRAVRQCPGCKQLWLAGFEAAGSSVEGAGPGLPSAAAAASGRAAQGGLTPREVSELMDVMTDKGCRVLTDVVEVVMAALDEEQQHKG